MIERHGEGRQSNRKTIPFCPHCLLNFIYYLSKLVLYAFYIKIVKLEIYKYLQCLEMEDLQSKQLSHQQLGFSVLLISLEIRVLEIEIDF